MYLGTQVPARDDDYRMPKGTPDEIAAKLESILEQAAKSEHFRTFGQQS